VIRSATKNPTFGSGWMLHILPTRTAFHLSVFALFFQLPTRSGWRTLLACDPTIMAICGETRCKLAACTTSRELGIGSQESR
jgi:hypothetical protein